MKQAENHKKGLRWLWARNHMGNSRYNKNLKRLTILSAAGLFILLFLLVYIINAGPSVKSLYGDKPWANSQIEKQGTLADLTSLSRVIVTRFHQTESNVQSVFGVVWIFDILGIMVLVTNLFFIRRLKAELKKDNKTG